MKTGTIKQHYVWREYLRKFCFDNDKIYSLINKSKLVPNNLMNVSQERYFYKIEDFTHKEIKFLEDFIDDYLKHDESLLTYFKTILDGLKLTLYKQTNLVSEEFKNKFEKEFQKDFFEQVLVRNENLGRDLINIKSLKDLEKSLDKDNIANTHLYLSIQLLRTKKQKLIFLENFNVENINAEKIWFFTTLAVGNILARNLTFNSNCAATLVINCTKKEFITSDHPIINLKDEKNEYGLVSHFHIFYPLSPELGLILDFDSKENSIAENDIHEESYIDMLNEMVIKNSETFLFSKSIKILEEIKTAYNSR